jgi:uncharacterized protein YbaA (DUF1428 family)
MPMYVDGYVLPVPKAKLKEYLEMAQLAGKVWRDHGALSYVESVAEDVKPGEHTSFPQAVKLQEGETIIFAWATYKSREHRDQVMEAVMKDPRMKCDPANMPFDGKRMFWGGFETIVEM